MKSKTSCFNRTIFKKNLTHYWPLWAAYLALLFLMGPFNIWQRAANEWYLEYYNETSRMHEIIYSAVQMMINPIVIFMFAAAVALAVFSYLYSAKSANMMHALPVNRLELYVTNYLSGLSFLVLPQIVVFFVSVLVCLANEITCIQYLFMGLLCQIGLAFFAYSLAVFVAMFTGQLLAMPVYYFVLNYLYVGCVFIVNQVMQLLSYGVTDRWNPGKSCILSPLYYLNNNLWVTEIYEEGIDTVTGLEIKGMCLVAIYVIAAVVITVVGYQVYRRRRIETAGDWISVGFVKPVFRWGVAFYGGILLALAFTSILNDSHHMNNVYVCTVICLIATGFICFFAAEMLLRKNFRVFKKKRLIEWVGFTAAAVLFLTLFEADVFGIERFLPEEDEIVAAFVNMDYPVWVEKEDIPQLLEMHHDAIAGKKEYQRIEQEGHGYYYTTFRYYLQDGSMFERRYPIPVTEEYVENATTPTAKILAWEREPENLKRYILGMNYDTNQYISGYIDLYNEADEYRNYIFSEEETRAIEKAVEKDIEAGNYADYYLNSLAGEGMEEYYNNISFDYFNRKGYYDIWYYYSNYADYYIDNSQTVMERATQANSYTTFGPECEYTVKALEELGITDDTWKLCTKSEYFD